MRPPYLSVHIPRGTRISEPVSTGVAVSNPNCVAFKSSIFLIGMPITANIIQIAKQTVNAIVLMIATDHCLVLRLVSAPRGPAVTADIRLSGFACIGMQASGRGAPVRDRNQVRTVVSPMEEAGITPK